MVGVHLGSWRMGAGVLRTCRYKLAFSPPPCRVTSDVREALDRPMSNTMGSLPIPGPRDPLSTLWPEREWNRVPLKTKYQPPSWPEGWDTVRGPLQMTSAVYKYQAPRRRVWLRLCGA